MKPAGVKWLREVLAMVGIEFRIPEGADEDVASHDASTSLVPRRSCGWRFGCTRIASCFVAAVIRYTSLRPPIAELNHKPDARKKGCHNITVDKTLGFLQVVGQHLSIDHPDPNSDADWHIDDYLSAASFFVDPHGN